MHHAFALGRHVTLELRSSSERDLQWARKELAPFTAGPPTGVADVALEEAPAVEPLVDLQRDAGDGLLTGTDGRAFSLIVSGRRCAIPASPDEHPARFAYEPGFPLSAVYPLAVRPALHRALVRNGAVAVHSATAVVEGSAVIVAGWSESGKTETALGLAEEGAAFLSDKWTILAPDGTVAAFPMRVGVRRWVLPHLPKLRARLSAAARGQLLVAAGAGAAARPLRRLEGRGGAAARLAVTSERAVALADRVALTLPEVAEVYGSADALTAPVPLRALVLLTTVPEAEGISVRSADLDWVARRLADTAAFERRAYDSLFERARYVLPDRRPGGSAASAAEHGLLLQLLAGVQLWEVRAPFPADPRQVARAVLAEL
jgi:hypothetical protein